MKEATKSTSKKKKSPKKENGFQTITSMFKKQHLATTLSKSEIVACSSFTEEDDKDVFITHVEEKSEYFSVKGKTSKSMNRLSLRKNRTKEKSDGTGTCISTAKNTVSNVQETVDTDKCVVRNIRRTFESHDECEISKETEKTANDEQQPCLSDSSMGIDPNRKLSFRKRKSGEEDTNLIKKLKYDKDTNPVKNLKSDDDVRMTEKRKAAEDTNLFKNLKNSDDAMPKDRYSDSKSIDIHVRPSVSPLSNKVADNYKVDIKVEQTPNHQIPVKKEADPTASSLDLPEEEESVIRTPYYLENFRTIISAVLSYKDNAKLFNADDKQCINVFGELSEPAQKLYVRLFGRKWKWLTQQQIKYPRIKEDLNDVFTELKEKGFLMSENDLDDLEKALNLLSAPDLKSFAKTYHLTSTANKKEIIPSLLKKCTGNTIGSMFKVSGHDPRQAMLKRVKKVLGPCVCLSESPRFVFVRMLMLFSLTDTILDDDNANPGQTQLFRMLQVNIGETVYPTFTVSRVTQIFKDRDSVLRFSEACLLEADLWSKLERNDFGAAYPVYLEAQERVLELKKDKALSSYDKTLPEFLRPFTSFSVYTRILNQGVELLQRRKDYKEAVSLLRKLLGQKVYCVDYRGHWWERLALNYDAHLKNPEKALEAVESGLKDDLVTAGRRLALYQRAEKICSAPKSKYKDRLKKLMDESVRPTPEVCIEGTVLSDNMPGMRYKFIMADTDGDTDKLTFCGVEELVMEHYKNNGYPEGLHAEGSIMSNLLGLFFWDILFMDVPDVFHSAYQTHPLDLYSTQFYSNRKSAIDSQLEKIKQATEEELHAMMAAVWEAHFGVMCTGLNWERFLCLSHAQGLVSCIGGRRLSLMLERLVKNPRHTRSGFPDLTLWNPQTGALKICEVKGPNDRLSHKQILWIDYLVSIGVDAEVCYVKAVGSKKLKSST